MMGDNVGGELAGLEQGDEIECIGQHFSNLVGHKKVKRDAEGNTAYKGLKL